MRSRRKPRACASSRDTCIWEMPSERADLGLGHVAVEPHQQDALLAPRQFGPVRLATDCMSSVCSTPGSSSPSTSAGPGASGAVGQRCVQRSRLHHQVGPTGPRAPLLRCTPDGSASSDVRWAVTHLLGHLAGRPRTSSSRSWSGRSTCTCQRLSRKCRLSLPADARLRVRGQAAARSRVEVVDRLDQAHVTDLHQVLGGLRAAPVPVNTGADQAPVALDEQLARGGPAAAGRGQRVDKLQQLTIAGGFCGGGHRFPVQRG